MFGHLHISIDGFKYYAIFVDHFTRYTCFYPLKQKSQVHDVFTRFKALVENRFQTKLRTLYTYNGGDFIALKSLMAFLILQLLPIHHNIMV